MNKSNNQSNTIIISIMGLAIFFVILLGITGGILFSKRKSLKCNFEKTFEDAKNKTDSGKWYGVAGNPNCNGGSVWNKNSEQEAIDIALNTCKSKYDNCTTYKTEKK